MPRVRPVTSTNPVDFPVEIAMLFERAAYLPIRVPEPGKGFDSARKAMGTRLVLGKWKAQMARSKDSPRAWTSLIATLQFSNPEKDADGWCFYIKPLLDGNPTVSLVKGVVGNPVTADTFWETYKQ